VLVNISQSEKKGQRREAVRVRPGIAEKKQETRPKYYYNRRSDPEDHVLWVPGWLSAELSNKK